MSCINGLCIFITALLESLLKLRVWIRCWKSGELNVQTSSHGTWTPCITGSPIYLVRPILGSPSPLRTPSCFQPLHNLSSLTMHLHSALCHSTLSCCCRLLQLLSCGDSFATPQTWSSPGSSEISHTRILEWVAIPSSRGNAAFPGFLFQEHFHLNWNAPRGAFLPLCLSQLVAECWTYSSYEQLKEQPVTSWWWWFSH